MRKIPALAAIGILVAGGAILHEQCNLRRTRGTLDRSRLDRSSAVARASRRVAAARTGRLYHVRQGRGHPRAAPGRALHESTGISERTAGSAVFAPARNSPRWGFTHFLRQISGSHDATVTQLIIDSVTYPNSVTATQLIIDSVTYSVTDSNSVTDSRSNSITDSVTDSILDSVTNSRSKSITDSITNSVTDSITDSITNSVTIIQLIIDSVTNSTPYLTQ